MIYLKIVIQASINIFCYFCIGKDISEKEFYMASFSEDSRVKFPTIMHLMGMGYKYISQKGLYSKYVNAPKTDYDPRTNILLSYFKEAYRKLNHDAAEDGAEKMLARIQTVLSNDDLGRQFYKEVLLNTEERIIDLSSPFNFAHNNTFQVATEMTCGDKDGDNYRPDITLFINGLPLAFIEVKKENNHKGIQAETERMKVRFQNPAFRRYLNITQIMVSATIWNMTVMKSRLQSEPFTLQSGKRTLNTIASEKMARTVSPWQEILCRSLRVTRRFF